MLNYEAVILPTNLLLINNYLESESTGKSTYCRLSQSILRKSMSGNSIDSSRFCISWILSAWLSNVNFCFIDFIESRNHRTAWVGRDLKPIQFQTPPPPTMSWAAIHHIRLPRAPFNLSLNTSRNGAATNPVYGVFDFDSYPWCTTLPSHTCMPHYHHHNMPLLFLGRLLFTITVFKAAAADGFLGQDRCLLTSVFDILVATENRSM